MIGIYLIQNRVNGKIYIGQSINLPQRFGEHRYKLKNSCHGNKHLQNAWNKYGEENFEFSILFQCSIERLTINEQIAKDYFSKKVGVYNKGECVDNPNKGKICSLETRQKLSKLAKGRKLTQKIIQKLQKAHKTTSIERINKQTGEVKEYFSQQEAKRDGFNQHHIWACCVGQRKSHKGFYWQYLNEVIQ